MNIYKLHDKDNKPDKEAIKSLAQTIHQMMTAERIDVKIEERECPPEPKTSASY